ncbi:IS1096 element passenger TnpR family protein [Myroides sp. C15-4]|uniref:IS1096 element passenger TnpR family protein n=1 Tax=Myroides sp. C15-4 TaxID=3400532 RepID=UPI003D2F9A72
MVYKFRVILDTEEDIFRDIAILEDDTLEDLHNAIVNAFGFDGMEAASFYACDDSWAQQEEEISLFDMSDDPAGGRTMGSTTIGSVLDEDQTKIIYVYDFLNMWTFFVELAAIEEEEPGTAYPELLFSHGILPDHIPTKSFTSDPVSNDDIYGDFDDDYDEEDYDMFEGDDSFTDYGEDNY